MGRISKRSKILSVNTKKNSSLYRNTWLNLFGQGLPLVLAFLLLPVILKIIGPERMGVLTTIWVVVGYFLLLDLGLGRAVIHFVAEQSGLDKDGDVAAYVWPALGIVGAASILGASSLSIAAPYLVDLLLNVPENLRAETQSAFVAIGLSLPFVTLTSCLRGVLEARHKFVGANVLQGFSSAVSVLIPLLIAFFAPNLAMIAWGLFAARAILLAAHFLMAAREYPGLWARPRTTKLAYRRLLQFGTWSTVTNVVGPVMVYMDRLVVGSRIDVALVPVYALPHEAVTRLLIFPSAVARALFPKMSSVATHEKLGLSKRVLSLSTVAIFPVALLLVYFSENALALWLGKDLGLKAAPILKVLGLGYFFNAICHVPFIRIQSLGRPDLTAKAHVVELPFYLVILFALTNSFGAPGAAWAWLIRVFVDCFIMFWLAERLQKGEGFWREHWGVVLAAITLLPGLWLSDLSHRAVAAFLAAVIFGALSWKYWLSKDLKAWLFTRFYPISGKGA